MRGTALLLQDMRCCGRSNLLRNGNYRAPVVLFADSLIAKRPTSEAGTARLPRYAVKDKREAITSGPIPVQGPVPGNWLEDA